MPRMTKTRRGQSDERSSCPPEPSVSPDETAHRPRKQKATDKHLNENKGHGSGVLLVLQGGRVEIPASAETEKGGTDVPP